MVFRMITPRPVIVENRYRFLFGFIWSISGWFQGFLLVHFSVEHVGADLKDSLRIVLFSGPIFGSEKTANSGQKYTFGQFVSGQKQQFGT